MSAKRHGNPGEWAQLRGTIISFWPLLLCAVLLGALATALVLGRYVLLFTAAFVAAAALTLFLWRKGLRRVESYFKGACGEVRVAAVLEALPASWHVFNDFEAGKHHVDHVVVGTAGVYAVETKNWNGKVTVEEGEMLYNGVLPDRSPLKQALREAEAVKAVLAKAGWNYVGTVQPVVCMASDACAADGAEVGGVHLLNASSAVEWFARREPVLSEKEVERLAQLMEARPWEIQGK